LGCGSDGGDTNTINGVISGVAFKGPVNSGEVKALRIDLNDSGNKIETPIGTGTTNLGIFSLSLGGAGTEIELRVVSGTFTDEVAGGNPITILSGNPLRTCISEFNGASLSKIAITPITTLACEIADYLIETGMGVAEAFTKANDEIISIHIVPNSIFSQLDVIHTLPAPYPPSTPIVFDNNFLYTLLIVGLSEEARNITGIDVMEFLALLKRDAGDGTFNGAEGVDLISLGGNGGEPLSNNALTTGLTQAIEDILSSLGSTLPATTTNKNNNQTI